MILVQRVVDGGDLALAEGVVEGVVDLAGGDAEALGRLPVDGDLGLEPALLLIAVDIGQLRDMAQRLGQLRRPFMQIAQIVALQGVLVLRVALAPADPDVLDRLQEKLRARHRLQLAAQPGDDLVGGELALGQGLQLHEDEARIGLAAAGEADHAADRRILHQYADELGHLLAHQLEGDALVRPDAADEPPLVLLREEALGHDGEEIDIEEEGRDEHGQDQERVAERPAEAPPVDGEKPLEAGAERAREAAGAVLRGRGQQPGAHHRGRAQRDDQGDHDGDGEGEGEFAEDAPDDPAHQQDRQEDRNEREAHGDDGEADLAGAQYGGLEAGHAGFDMAGDVLQHHDGIVDDEAGGDRQRH